MMFDKPYALRDERRRPAHDEKTPEAWRPTAKIEPGMRLAVQFNKAWPMEGVAVKFVGLGFWLIKEDSSKTFRAHVSQCKVISK